RAVGEDLDGHRLEPGSGAETGVLVAAVPHHGDAGDLDDVRVLPREDRRDGLAVRAGAEPRGGGVAVDRPVRGGGRIGLRGRGDRPLGGDVGRLGGGRRRGRGLGGRGRGGRRGGRGARRRGRRLGGGGDADGGVVAAIGADRPAEGLAAP